MVYTYCDKGCDKLSNWANATTGNNSFYVYDPQPGIGSIPLVLPNGDLGIVFEGDYGGLPAVKNPPTEQPDSFPGNDQLQYAVAKAAGSTPFPAPLAFTMVAPGISAVDNNPVAEQRAGTLPSAAVDPTTGEIVVAWEDGRFRTDGLNDIVYSSSTDGVTWTPAHRVNSDPEGDHVDHWNAMVDVRGGVLHVGYRQRLERKGPQTSRSATGLSPRIDTFYQRSTDGGRHWSAPLKVNTVSTDVGYAAFSRHGAFLGDYNQLAVAANGWVYLVHNEALPKRRGEACNCSFTSGNGHQHQYTYVAVIAPTR